MTKQQTSKPKAKPKAPTKATKPRAADPRAIVERSHRAGVKTGLSVPRVCGITDPFCVHAGGAKYPDQSSVRTLPYTRRLRYTLVSDVNGYANLIIMPQYAQLPYANQNVYAGNAVTSWSNFGAASTISGVSGYRIVSSGYVVRHVVSPLNSAGMVYIREYGTENNLLIAPIDTTTYNATAVSNVSVQDAKEIAVVLQRTSQMPQTFYSPTTDSANVGNATTRGFTASTIGIAGAPASTPILEIEFVINFELMFADDSDLAQVATPPPAYSGALTNAAATVTSTLQPIVTQGVQALGKQIATKAATTLSTMFFGPAGGAFTRSALAITVD